MSHIVPESAFGWLCPGHTHTTCNGKKTPAAASRSVPALTDQVVSPSLRPQMVMKTDMSHGNQFLPPTTRAALCT